jgi:two-component system LytT family sensor kinase
MANSTFKQQAFRTFQNYRWILHLLFWSLLFTSFYFSYINTTHLLKPGYPKSIFIASLSIRFLVFFFVAYTFLFFVVPLSKKPKKYIYWFSLGGVVLFGYLLQVVLLMVVLGSVPASLSTADNSFSGIFARHYSGYLIFLSVFIAFYYFVDIYDQQKGLKKLQQYKTQKIALESSFLKSQINPHFLFNTLNNIYALSMKKSEQTKVIIERLESLLHYMLYECKADLVPLENEFTFTDSYIALEKLRHKEDQCKVTVEINGEAGNKKIAPLLLINFLENAFKHGTKTSFGNSWINLQIDITDEIVHFKLQNSKPFNMVGQAISDYKGGIGLKNVKRRLEILYPQRHELSINNLKDRFEVDLSINL